MYVYKDQIQHGYTWLIALGRYYNKNMKCVEATLEFLEEQPAENLSQFMGKFSLKKPRNIRKVYELLVSLG